MMQQTSQSLQPASPPVAKDAARQRWSALVLSATFMVLVVVPGAYHLALGVRETQVQRWTAWLTSQPPAEAVRLIETDLDQTFVLGQMARTLLMGIPGEAMRWRALDARAGVDGFMFYGVDIQVGSSGGFLDRHFGRGEAAAAALVDLAEQLRRRGIHLLVVPIPAKSSIYPERLNPQYDAAHGPLLNVDHQAWMQRLQRGGVDVLDMTALFWSQRYGDGGLLYPPSDTHWSHHGTQLAAEQIAQRIRPHLRDAPPARPFEVRTIRTARQGDIVRMVELQDSSSRVFDIVEDQVHLFDAGRPLIPGDEAPVLLLGDSFAASFQQQGAGLAQQITARLGIEVQSAAEVGAKADQMRRVLSTQPQLLEHKRVVVLAFTIRLLICCEWTPTPLPTK